jgi:hypothetical protein
MLVGPLAGLQLLLSAMGSAVLFVMHCIADVANQVIGFGLVLVQVQLPMVQGRRSQVARLQLGRHLHR